MDNEYLKYGDQICLYNEDTHGYLATIGFNAPKLYLQKCSQLHQSHIVNLSNLVFEIVPKLDYGMMKEFRRDKKAQKLKSASGIKDSPEDVLIFNQKMKMLEKRISL